MLTTAAQTAQVAQAVWRGTSSGRADLLPGCAALLVATPGSRRDWPVAREAGR
jgi:hypothetical protein